MSLNFANFTEDAGIFCLGYTGTPNCSMNRIICSSVIAEELELFKCEDEVKQMVITRSNGYIMAAVTMNDIHKFVVYYVRQFPKPAYTYECHEEIFALKISGDTIAAFCEKSIHMLRIGGPPQFWRPCDSLEKHPSKKVVSAFVADVLAYQCAGGRIRIYNVKDSRVVREIDAHITDISMVALNPNASLVATTSQRGSLCRIFDVASGARIIECRLTYQFGHVITGLTFSPCSKYLAVAGCYTMQFFPVPVTSRLSRAVRNITQKFQPLNIMATKLWLRGAVEVASAVTAVARWSRQERALTVVRFPAKMEGLSMFFGNHKELTLQVMSPKAGIYCSYDIGAVEEGLNAVLRSTYRYTSRRGFQYVKKI